MVTLGDAGIQERVPHVQLPPFAPVVGVDQFVLPPATALVQAQLAGTFTAAHEAFWAAARKAHGDGDGTRELVEVLLLHRRMRAVDVVDGLAAALAVGAVHADIVAVEARRVAQARPVLEDKSPSTAPEPARKVISLTERRLSDPAAVIAGLPADQRPLPSVTAYDQLRARRAHPAATDDPIDVSEGHVS